jgi:putative heme iron utilization protein
MTPEDRTALRELLAGQRVLALGVVAEGEPIVGLLPYAVAPGFEAVYVQASRLARHARGLVAGAPFGAVIHEPDGPAADPLQIPRLTLEGIVHPVSGGDAGHEAAMHTFLRRFPAAAATLSLPDFSLYRLEIRGGRLIRGFGQALNLMRDHFRDLASV